MIKFYLASRFGRRDELNGYAQDLRRKGYEVTSRWLTQHQKIDIQAPGAKYSFDDRRLFAMHDYEDVLRADRLIAFTEDPADLDATGGRRGGRHVELGLALAKGKHVYVVGHYENVFCHLPQVMFFDHFDDLWRTLEDYSR